MTQQEQLIAEMLELLKRYDVTSFYSVIEIKEPDSRMADFCAVIGGGAPSPVLQSLGQQTFRIIRSISRVDLSQVKDN